MVSIDEKELDVLRSKAKKWDKLDKAIGKCHMNEDGTEADCPDGLLTIGEIAASHLGFL